MSQVRMERVGELMKQELSKIILQDLKDPRIGFVTVTQVDVSPDLHNARVYVSLMGSDEQMKACWQGLKSSLGYMRREVGHRVRLRYTPELTLALDKTLAYSAHMQALFIGIENEEKAKAQHSEEEDA